MGKYLILFFILIGATANAQNPEAERIRRNPDYIFAEGEGMFLEDADKEALRLLSSQIWTFVVSETTSSANTRIEGGRIAEESEQLAAFDKSFTASTIPNARMLIIAEEPECRVLRYVSKSDVEAMLNAKSERIIDLVNAAKRAEQQLQIDDALRNYYWALMLAKSHTRPVYVDIGGHKVDCRSELFDKIKQVIGSITENVEMCETVDGLTKVTLRFRYGGNDVASLQFRYDAAPGERVGPIAVKNGVAEIDVRQLPDDGKLLIQYEYRFAKEAANLDKELEAVFASTTHPKGIDSRSFVNLTDMLAGRDKKKRKEEKKKEDKPAVPIAETAEVSFTPEPYRQRDIREFTPATNTAVLAAAMTKIEEAINAKSPALARDCFSDDGYVFFTTLLQKTGTVSLVGKQEYEFVDAGSQILARHCKTRIKFRDGRQFMENIVFRFNPATYKIESLAFGLTKVAEECILNARSSWSEVSAFTILRFMEDYQTAYALKRLDFIKNLFSEHAIIITGSVLSPTKGHIENSVVFGNDENVKYQQYTRDEYIRKLERLFKYNEYYHLTFEDNVTGIVNTNGMLPVGSAFAIQIRQIYNSPNYSDRGYLTLFLNMQNEDPIIEVRLWQPERDVISYNDFIKKFNIQ